MDLSISSNVDIDKYQYIGHIDARRYTPRAQETDTMHDRYERNDSLVSWMIAGGPRFDEPDPRRLLHLVALRDARRESSRESSRSISPLAWLTARLAPKATVAASASGVASAALSTSSTSCCAPA
jgi:hypothetical protein